MIEKDRIELNERFVKAFQMLEDKGYIQKNNRDGKGMGDFAFKILGERGYGHIIRAYLNTNDKRCLDYKHVDKLCEHYPISREFMLYGIGSPFQNKNAVKPKSDLITPIMKPGGNILYTNVAAFAGSSVELSGPAPEDNTYFSIPDLPGTNLVAFSIDGNSMEPLIKFGDMVICEPIARAEDIRDNDIYAVKNNGSIWVKYVQRIFNKKNKVSHLKLISENKLEHDPFTEDVNEYTRLYRVIRLIGRL